MKRSFLLTFLFGILFGAIFSCTQKTTPGAYRFKLNTWQIQSTDSTKLKGRQISVQSFNPKGWFPAHVPGTVMGNLVRDGKYPHIFKGMNLKRVSQKPFEHIWWYRTQFDLPDLQSLPQTVLRFNGINYRANIWLNGKQIASKDSVFGAFRIFEFKVSNWVKEKNNVLTVQVFPPKAGDFTIGFVDWNPPAPDKNMGLWRPVEVLRSKSVRLKEPFVKVKLDSLFKKAKLSVRVALQNLTDVPVSGTLEGAIGTIQIRKPIKIAAGQTMPLVLDANDFPQLIISNPKLWWPHHFGQPNLYHLKLRFKIKGQVSDCTQTTFGIRKVESYFTKEGYRGFKINGQKILIQGAGWTDDLFLSDTPQKVRAQLQYVKQANLNTVRLEGFWGNDQTLYNTCDSLGILIMAGFSCHWEWESYLGKTCDRFGGASTEQDFNLLSAYWRDQITWLRNHPSVFVWLGGSDMLPRPELEQRYLQILKKIDGTRPYLGAAANAVSKISGATGVKMNGPYDYVPPKYWYEDTNHGGAFCFNTETGPGPQPPPLSSLKKMIPENHLWPIDSVWDYHCGRNEFNSLKRYRNALNKRYGQPTDLQDFIKKAQAMNYEAMRPMFEAFAVNKFHATGVIQWMLNSAWPELYWQLYDYYLMPNGAFYGAKKACASLQLIYDYKDHFVYLHNNTLAPAESLRAEMRLFDVQSNLMDEQEKNVPMIAANSVRRLFPVQNQLINTQVYFLDLKLKDARQKTIASNFYWLAKHDDHLAYDRSTWYVTPIKYFADFTALNHLPKATVSVRKTVAPGQNALSITLNNTSDKIAFMLYLELQDANGEPVLPAFWDDNFISLLPHETRTLTVHFPKQEGVQVQIQGWNLAE